MSKLYDALRKLEAERGAAGIATPSRLDAVRLAQFLDLHDGLFRTPAGAEAVAGRFAHGIGRVLGLAGVGIGLVRGGRYRLLAVHGVARDLLAADDGLPPEDTSVAPALASGRPLVLGPSAVGLFAHRVVLPFHAEAPGVLQLLVSADAALSPDDVALARVLAAVAGMAVGRAAASDSVSARAPRPAPAIAW
ncbi:MAG TPA: hypothetical protein VFD84_11615 [Candidatus Binatia bacterium]|nr:hypothetical protein [Candidatus Binatia bacterium]